jgi:AcrR family transcriptional regulator
MTERWLQPEREDLAVERILDAAEELFAARGVAGVGMAEVAQASGCSRATLYRYFENRGALRIAFIHREARRIGRAVAREAEQFTDPSERVVEALSATLRLVRANPNLVAWFGPDNVGVATSLAQSSAVIESIVLEFLGDSPDPDTLQLARWIVRIIVSLLSAPGHDEADERTMIERFVVPVVFAPTTGTAT